MLGKQKSGKSKKSNLQDNILTASAVANQPHTAADDTLQNKIITYFSNGQDASSIPHDHVTTTPEQRQDVINRLKSGKISEQDLGIFLQQVMSPLQDSNNPPEKVFQTISTQPREKQILAVLTGYDASNWQNVSAADLKNLLSKPTKNQPDYRTPLGFANFREKFISGITAQATPDQLQEYQDSMDHLEQTLYGRRWDYYQQILLLSGKPVSQLTTQPDPETSAINAIVSEQQNKTSAQPVAQTSTTPSEPAQSSTSLTDQTQAIQAITPTAASVQGFATLTNERSAKLLNRAVIEGDPWKQDHNDYRLTTANLLNSGLVPAYEFTLDGQNLILSTPFQLSDGRGAILGFIPAKDTIKVRSFYINPKTGLWHYAPDIIRGPHSEGMSQIGEANSPLSTLLPLTLQDRLADLIKSQGFRELTTVNADFLFAGTTYGYNTPQDYRNSLNKGQMRGDFYQEVDQQPIRSQWQPSGKIKNVPQLLSVNSEMAPNFQALLAEFTSYSTLAGQISVHGFASQDGQSQWVFCSDDWGRAWISNIEIISPVTSCACRRDWMSAGDMLTPLYEYSTQAGNYGDPSDTRKGLTGMWNQYLSKIPLIQEYTAWRSRRNTQ